MASRAVHADLTDDQSAESFLQAYSRFVALRGHPKKQWSDRGTNFVGAKASLRELHKHLACLQAAPMEDVAAKNGTEWKWEFHPADAPHRNGKGCCKAFEEGAHEPWRSYRVFHMGRTPDSVLSGSQPDKRASNRGQSSRTGRLGRVSNTQLPNTGSSIAWRRHQRA